MLSLGKSFWAIAYIWLVSVPALFAASQSGTDWAVYWNHPDQNALAGFTNDEFELKNHLVSRLQALGSGDSATLSTFTASGNEGGLGRLMYEMDEAMGRGATIRFIADSDVDAAASYSNNVDFTGRTLNGLDLNPNFTYVEDDSVSGIHHNKFALFDYGGAGSRYVFTSSANLTGGSPTFQWNIGVDIKSDALFAAFDSEATELLAGRFHDDALKSHVHDESAFTFDGATDNEARFTPAPGVNNPETDIVAMIDAATDSIVFGLNKLTRTSVQDALVAAADRGVKIYGSIPVSDQAGDSSAVYAYLSTPGNYVTANVVNFINAYEEIAYTNVDDGSAGDLIHSKYMVIDRERVIHGSANWTNSALVATALNDENILYILHNGVAEAFLSQYADMTNFDVKNNIPAHVVYPEPAAHPAGFTATATELHIDLSWADSAAAQVPTGYLLLANTSGTFADPVDGTDPAADLDLSDGSAVIKVLQGTQSAQFNGLTATTQYYFKIFSYTNSGVNINFKTDGTPPADDDTTGTLPTIIVSEIMQNPAFVGDASGEYVEVFNPGAASVDLLGWTIEDAGGDSHVIASSVVVPAAGFAVLGNNDDGGTNGGVTVDYEYSSFNLSNGDDEVILIYRDGSTEMDRVEYDGGFNWPDPTGAGMVFAGTSALDNNDFSNWTTATAREATFTGGGTDLGSPGSNGADQNLVVVVDPEPAAQASGFAATATNLTIDLAWTDSVVAQVPTGYLILANLTGTFADPADGTDPAVDSDLSDGWAVIKVLQGAQSAQFSGLAATTRYYFKIFSYTNSGVNIDFKIDGSPPADDDTTGTAPPIPDIMITEIMQNPASVGDADGEYFEVFNNTGSAVDLNGWTIKDAGTDSHVIASSVIVPAGGFAVLAKDAVTANNGGVTVDYEYSGITLGNADDELILIYSDTTTEVDRVEYDGGPNWPDPSGSAMVFTAAPAADNNDFNNWTTATAREASFSGVDTDNGSPGSNGSDQNLTGGTTFSTWIAGYYGSAPDNLTTSDPDGDGMENFLEYAFAANPTTVDIDVKSPTIAVNGSNFDFTFHRGQSGVSYQLEKSTDLSIWSDHGAPNPGSVGGDVTVSVSDTEMVGGRLFLRIKASE